MSNSIQRAMVNLTQLIRLHDYYEGAVELDKLGAIDMYYLEAINQLDNPTIGTISKLLGQSTPNTNALAQQSEFWDNLQERLEDEVSPRDLAIFKRVLRQTTEFIAENNPR